MPLGQFDERLIGDYVTSLTNSAVPNTYTDFFTATNYDARLDVIQLVNTDSIAHHLAISFAADDQHIIAEVEIPAGTGVGTTPPLDFLAFALPAANHYMRWQVSITLSWTVREAINTGKAISAYVGVGYF